MASSARSSVDVLDEIERLEQNITRTLQEIDQSFSDCQIIVSSKILPQIDRFSETSQGVWENARIWLDFFETAASPVTPTVGRRAQAAREARERQQAAFPQSSSSPPQTPNRDNLRDSTNRRRKDSTNSTSLRLLADSPLSSMPSTPTPIRKGRKISQYLGDVVPPAMIEWEDMNENNIPTTPTRPSNRLANISATEGGSTTPMITAHDKPLSMSLYSLSEPPRTPSAGRQKPCQSLGTPRKGQDAGFVEFNIEEDYQEVISPPTTLQFSIPESRLATTPRSVIAKSKVDKILMKDGLVIPQPIFVNDDDDVDAAITEKYIGESSADGGIGGSKKRNREGDYQESELNDRINRTKSWASLTEQQRNKERLLKSPRKMASVQDFFSPPPQPPVFLSKSSSNASELHEEAEEEDQGHSPSRDLISQIEAQTDTTTEIDPLIAALETPPETRRAIMDSKARASLMPQLRSTVSNISSSSSSSLLSKVSAPVFSMPEFIRSNSSASISNPTTTAAPTTTVAPSTTAPTSTTAETTLSKDTGSAIGSAFLNSFNSAFAATSNRRQTMATTRSTGFPNISQSTNNRNSIGPGYRATLTSTPFGNSGAFGAARRPEPLSAGRATASAIVAAATAVSSASISAAPSSRTEILSTPTFMKSNSHITRMNLSNTSSTESKGAESGSSRGFTTPFANRVPPPAPKLGYLSDTIMTQSSLGLNHDGFGGFDSEDRTRTTINSNTPGNEIGGGSGLTQDSDGMSSRPYTESGISESSGGLGDQSNDYGFDDEDDEDDNDATEHIMKSPCPPGKSFQGSNTDLRSVADNNKNGGLNFFR